MYISGLRSLQSMEFVDVIQFTLNPKDDAPVGVGFIYRGR